MSPDLKRLLPRPTSNEELMQSRQELFDSLHPRRVDRRREARVPLPREESLYGGNGKAAVLNLGHLGLAIQVDDHCRFARGERHRLTLSQGASSIDVEATVRWTYSDWRDRASSGQTGYRQMAGFSIEAGPTRQLEKEWRWIAGTIQAAPTRLTVSRFEAVQSCSRRDH